MPVIFGSARGSYGNTARGDQSGGKEVSTQTAYVHSKGWRVFRAKDPAKRTMLAQAMKSACANNNIGYSQPDRLALFNQVKTKAYDPAKATEKTNTDCSALVRVCCWYAGIQVRNFTTADEPSALLATGEFDEITFTKIADLHNGDILDTKTKGHTVIVVSGGITAPESEPVKEYNLGDRSLKNGDSGADVKELQGMLIQLGYNCGSYGMDGDFGDCTEQAVRRFQSDNGLVVDGVAGGTTIGRLITSFTDEPESGTSVKITGGNCYVRDEPNVAGDTLGIAYAGTTYVYAGRTSEDGWHSIVFNGSTAWVSGKYGKVA